MKFQSITSLAILNAIVASAASVDPTQLAEIGVLLGDIKSNRDQYQTFLVENQSFSFPNELIGLFTAITTYTDDSYLSLITSVDSSYIQTAITALPWYSTRLLPELESAVAALATAEIVSTADATAIASALASSYAPASSYVASPSASTLIVKSSSAPISSASPKKSGSSGAAGASSSGAADSSAAASSSSSKGAAAGNLQATDYFPAMLGVGAVVGALLI